ncbi:hypothetical protein [Pseudoalteromonas piscicida]|uniref:Uncharacterized protein n=1 Tax=Pseudoalteromonas piscicida TaxID=43662 RepID=A0A2A5JN55_PSEO7|nr:hypothetical protein [Pseudoalteromonas piscicida]PCK30691.1 hypothetical protein CEX98_16205 [Pseudoalteromonas piscicida]
MKNKLLLLSAVATAISLSCSVAATPSQLSVQAEQPVTVYDLPGTYFDTHDIRADEELKLDKNFPFQIRQPGFNSVAKSQLFLQSETVNAESEPTPAQRSGCPDLPLDNGVYVNFTEQGQIRCYSTEVTEPTKIEGLLNNIPTGVDYNLYLFKLEDDNSFTALDLGNSTTAQSERVVQKVDAGVYILAAEAVTGFSEEQSIMGWFSHTEFDQQESNDKPGQATILPANGTISGNIDNQNDLDYFVYQVGEEQEQITLSFSASEQFILELWNGSGWAKVPNNNIVNINTTKGSNAIFLVRGDSANQPPTAAQYAFTIADANAATKISTIHTWNNEQLTNLLSASLLEAHQEIGMSATAVNDAGEPVPFALIGLDAIDHTGRIGSSVLRADANGKFSTTVALPDCDGTMEVTRENRVTRGTPTNPELLWEIKFDPANYRYMLLDPSGSPKYTFAHEFAHICKEKIIESCYWDRDFSSGENKYICNRY